MIFYILIVFSFTSILQESLGNIQITRFSLYGGRSLARNPAEGTYRGRRTELRCSSVCAKDDQCMGYQVDSASLSDGDCFTFRHLTLTDFLVSRPNVTYYEKKICESDYPVDATVMHVQSLTVNFFRAQVVKSFRFIQENNIITNVVRMGQKPISDIYPGHDTSVDAALEINQMFPPRTVLIKGTKETCYERDPHVLTFTSCGVTNYFTAFFTQTGVTYVDAVVAYDDVGSVVHIFANNDVHVLQFNPGTSQYQWQSKHSMMDPAASNPWTNALPSLTAIYGMTTTTFYIFDKAKYVLYDVTTKQIVGSPIILCDG